MIQRTIYLNTIEELDLNNIGVHFSTNLSYKHRGGGSNGVTKTDTNFKVEITAKKYVINEEATKISNDGYPNEKEVVLEMNQEIEVQVRVSPKHATGGWAYPVQMYTTIGNTGTRADLWVKNIK